MSLNADAASILIADDLPENLLVYESVLSAVGEQLVLVSSGSQALKQVLQRQFAVILLDVNMPDMSGFETARLIRNHPRSSRTPIIFLTAFADEVRTAEGYASGAVDYLSTPVVPEILRAKVRIFVELFKMRQQLTQQAEDRARRAAAEDANRRLTFLSDAGAVLGQSLDFLTTARALVQLSVPFLADACLLSFDRAVAPVEKHFFSERVSEQESQVREISTLDGLPEAFQSLGCQALQCGASVQRPVTANLEVSAAPEFLAVPLQARQRTFAVLIFRRDASTGGLSASDVTLATALASRAETALDNALLHEELQKADRQKIAFLSLLAHELRNPLAPICNAVQLLRMRTDVDSELQWVGDVINRQVLQMARLVDDLLDVSRITSGKIRLQTKPMNLLEAVTLAVEASHPLIVERQHQLSVSTPPGSVWIEGDLARIAQALTNLLNNAAKYTENGGQIHISVREAGTNALISIGDTGIGIPPEMLPAVFDWFMQDERTLDRASGGLGIGLTLCRTLVEMHHGAVTAHSEGPGQGSIFTITLPTCTVPEAHLDASGGSDVDAPDAFQPSKTLIVDDNSDAADTLALLLQTAGHEVLVAYDGLSGVTLANDFLPDVVILDIGLPGLDGYGVAERLRQSTFHRDVVLVALSGYGQLQDTERSKQAGFDLHLVKPVEYCQLKSVLNRAWQRAVSP